jgi:hypothetical protein
VEGARGRHLRQDSPDGRYLTYVDWFQTGNLMIHDMLKNSDHALTSNKSGKKPAARHPIPRFRGMENMLRTNGSGMRQPVMNC